MNSEEKVVVADEVERCVIECCLSCARLTGRARVISGVHDRIRAWSGFSRTRAFIRHTEIRQGVQEAYDELNECSAKFDVRALGITLHACSSSYTHC